MGGGSMTTTFDAILSLRAGAEFSVLSDDDGKETIEWFDSKQTQPSDSDIATEKTRLDNLYTAEKYKRDRSEAYDPIKEQLDQIYWDKKNGTNKWIEAIDKVKSDNPKP